MWQFGVLKIRELTVSTLTAASILLTGALTVASLVVTGAITGLSLAVTGSVSSADLNASGVVSLSGLEIYSTNAAALAGGLTTGNVFNTAEGALLIVV